MNAYKFETKVSGEVNNSNGSYAYEFEGEVTPATPFEEALLEDLASKGFCITVEAQKATSKKSTAPAVVEPTITEENL